SGNSVFSRGSRNASALSRVTPRAARSCANAPLRPESDNARDCASSNVRKRHARPLNECATPSAYCAACSLRPSGFKSSSVASAIAERMAHLDPAHGLRGRAHHDRVRRHAGAYDAHTFEHRAARDTGRRKDDIAGGQILQQIFAAQIANAELLRALPLVVVAEHETRLQLAADTAERGGGEHAFGRPALPDIDV